MSVIGSKFGHNRTMCVITTSFLLLSSISPSNPETRFVNAIQISYPNWEVSSWRSLTFAVTCFSTSIGSTKVSTYLNSLRVGAFHVLNLITGNVSGSPQDWALSIIVKQGIVNGGWTRRGCRENGAKRFAPSHSCPHDDYPSPLDATFPKQLTNRLKQGQSIAKRSA